MNYLPNNWRHNTDDKWKMCTWLTLKGNWNVPVNCHVLCVVFEPVTICQLYALFDSWWFFPSLKVFLFWLVWHWINRLPWLHGWMSVIASMIAHGWHTIPFHSFYILYGNRMWTSWNIWPCLKVHQWAVLDFASAQLPWVLVLHCFIRAKWPLLSVLTTCKGRPRLCSWG